jgi:hypothetical protein
MEDKTAALHYLAHPVLAGDISLNKLDSGDAP